MNRHSYTFTQYCLIVDKNVTLEEVTYHNGDRKIRCLNNHKCKSSGEGCRNKYIIKRIEKAVENNIGE